MKKSLILIALLCAFAPPGFMEADASVLGLTLSLTSITFPDQDPDANPTSPAGATISVSCTTKGTPTWTLHALSRGDLTSSTGKTIPISNISWTSVKNFGDALNFWQSPVNMTTAAPGALVATGKGNDNTSGTLSFSILNLWSYDTGNYSQTTDFTLSAP